MAERTYTVEIESGAIRTVTVPEGALLSCAHHPGGSGGSMSVEFKLRGSMAEDEQVVCRVYGVRSVYRDDVKVERAKQDLSAFPRVLGGQAP